MKTVSAIQKGKLLENFIVSWLKSTGLDIRASRTPGSGNGLAKGDISNDLDLAIECKNTATINLKKTFQQAERQAMGESQPILIWHIPKTPIENNLVVMKLEFFEELMKAKQSKVSAFNHPDKQFTYKLKNLINNCKSVIKEIET